MANYVFNDTTGAQDGLIQECEDICKLGEGGISGSTSNMKTFTRRINKAKDKLASIAFRYDSLWNYDGDDQSDLPIDASGDIVSGTQTYAFDPELLMLSQIFIKDPNGTFHELTEQDDRNAPDSFTSTATGVPTKYKLIGNSFMFNITPNYNSTDGIKVVFKRVGDRFSYTDGAAAIGFPSIIFEYIANKASLPFLRETKLPHYAAVKQDVLEAETIHIPHFFANRGKPKRSGFRIAQESNK
jgi:hypothetical protein